MKRWFVLLLVVAGCSDVSPTAPEAFSRIPCRPPASLVSMVTGPAFSPAAMRSALLHAANPMSVALGTDIEVRPLQNAISIVVANIGASDNDGACRLLSIAATLLDGLPNTPATWPERDGIRLIFAVTAQALSVVLER